MLQVSDERVYRSAVVEDKNSSQDFMHLLAHRTPTQGHEVYNMQSNVI